jgi:DNA polymerase-1
MPKVPPSHSFDRDVDWSIVQTSDQMESTIRELADQKHYAWDTEGDGLNTFKGRRIIGHSFAWRQPNKRVKAVYLPTRHDIGSLGLSLFDTEVNLDPEVVSAALKPILEDPYTRKTAHHAKHDIHMAYADGINVCGSIVDTVIGCKLVDETWHNHKLETCLAKAMLPFDTKWKARMRKEVERVAKQMKMGPVQHLNKYGYKYTSIPTCGRYACQDAAYELILGEWALPQVEKRWPDVWKMEMDLLWVCVDMERKGVPIDADRLRRLSEKAYAMQAKFAPQIFGAAGFEFDPGNDNEVRTALFDKLGFPAIKKTRGDKPQVNDDVLWQLEQGVEVPESRQEFVRSVIRPLREWRDYQKIKTTYTLGIIEKADANGILHAELDQGGAKTGRMASRQPNLQNMPVRTALGREVREAFITRPEMVRYCTDYSQIELRVLAHLTKDPLLLKIYREGLDAHAMTAVEAFGTSGKVGGVDMRKIAKILNFGVSFCMTEIGLMSNVNKDLPEGVPWITETKAKDFLAKFYRKYSSIVRYREYLWRCIEAHPHHYFENLFKRPRRMGKGFDYGAKRWLRRMVERQSIASMVQGSAADLIKFSMVEVHKFLKSQTNCEADLVLMVHDDFQTDMAIPGSAKTIREVKRIMETTGVGALKRISGVDFAVPVVADVEYFAAPDGNWANKHKMKMAA